MIALAVGLFVGVSPAASAAITVTRSEFNGTRLRVEGSGAVPNIIVTVRSPEQSVTDTADGAGAFQIERDPFRSSTCRITVTDGSTSTTATLSGCTVSQPPPAAVLGGLTLNPATVVGGNNASGTVRLSAPAVSATIVTLASSSAAANVPASVTIAAATSTASFIITTTAVNASTAATISASSGGATVSATLAVTPAAAPGVPTLSSLTLNPTSVPNGSTSTGTVSLSAAAGSATTVTLATSNLNVAAVPASVTIAAGATSASFTVTTTTPVPASTITITASSGGATKSATLTVQSSPLVINTAGLICATGVCELGAGNVGTFFAQFATSSGGTGPTPFNWTMIAGTLPDGLTLNDPRQCGVHCVSITGTPTTAQKTTFTIQVQDGAGATAQQAFSITINPPAGLVITNQSANLPPGTVGVNYPQPGVAGTQLFANGGVQPFLWSLAAGQLPPGLKLSQSGRISGTPSAAGTFTFTARVTDDAGAQATQQFSIAAAR